MDRIRILQIGDVTSDVLDHLSLQLSARFGAACEVLRTPLDPAPAFHASRRQFHSTDLLARMSSLAANGAWRILAVTPFDLYIPILTFVFGEAQLNGVCAIISTHRLRQEFYGLPPDAALLRDRTLKEAVHELGHTFGLTHCEDYQCAMAPSHAVEWIDLKSATFCELCRASAASKFLTAPSVGVSGVRPGSVSGPATIPR